MPGIPTLVYATNLLLHSSPLVQYYHQVSLDGANWSAYIPLSQPVANLLVYHRVVVVSGNGIDYEPQIPLQTLVTANYFPGSRWGRMWPTGFTSTSRCGWRATPRM